jgi:hypothetical protein
MAAFAKRAVLAFAQAGLKTKWLTGDTANGHNALAYCRTMLADAEARPHLGPISFHSWDALGASEAEYQALAALGKEYKRPVWCLEAGYDAQAWQVNPPVWGTWENALRLAQAYVFTIVHTQASVMDYWTYSDNYALASRAGEPYPAAEVLSAIGRVLGKGTRIVRATSDRDELTVVAGITSAGKRVVVLVNTGGDGSVKIAGLPPDTSCTRSIFQDGGTSAGSRGATIDTDAKGVLTLALRPRSVVVVTT